MHTLPASGDSLQAICCLQTFGYKDRLPFCSSGGVVSCAICLVFYADRDHHHCCKLQTFFEITYCVWKSTHLVFDSKSLGLSEQKSLAFLQWYDRDPSRLTPVAMNTCETHRFRRCNVSRTNLVQSRWDHRYYWDALWVVSATHTGKLAPTEKVPPPQDISSKECAYVTQRYLWKLNQLFQLESLWSLCASKELE